MLIISVYCIRNINIILFMSLTVYDLQVVFVSKLNCIKYGFACHAHDGILLSLVCYLFFYQNMLTMMLGYSSSLLPPPPPPQLKMHVCRAYNKDMVFGGFLVFFVCLFVLFTWKRSLFAIN